MGYLPITLALASACARDSPSSANEVIGDLAPSPAVTVTAQWLPHPHLQGEVNPSPWASIDRACSVGEGAVSPP